MEPEKRQKSWFSSISGITSLVGGGRSSTINSSSAAMPTNGGGRNRAARVDEKTPSRPSNTFSAPSPYSPESPAKRASPSLLAQRKILDRPQRPSNKLAANPPKPTNFSAASTPRNLFRNVASDSPAFTFTPRVPANTMKASFPPDTPGRSYRASTAELSGRGLLKTANSNELFRMRIPEPDPKLTGEVLAKEVPSDPERNGSVYAFEFLSHLCPPEFNDLQRRQFFCILDLRRLKYAADEIFLQKDWKVNILNFAKEYEKSRSLIMLKYGLFEFKTIKVSKDALRKWKKDHNIPDDEEAPEPVAPTTMVNGNGTKGILGPGKRKAHTPLEPNNPPRSAAATPQAKRVRSNEVREPLAETTTPALNSNKRKATVVDDADENPPSKVQKKAPQSSATKSLFEKIANSSTAKEKEAPAVLAKPAQLAEPAADAPQSALKRRPDAFSQTPNRNLARSVLDGGLKPESTKGNIFGYLSDASSAKGSVNENADADAEDTSEEEEESTQEVSQSDEPSVVASGGVATPQPGGGLFPVKKPATAITGSSTSSDTSEAASNRSIFDRIKKDENGQPMRSLPQDSNTSQITHMAASERAPSPEKQLTAPPANKTWNPDTPIKFAGSTSQAKPLFDLGGPKTASSIFAPKDSVAPGALFKFGSDTSSTREPVAENASKDTSIVKPAQPSIEFPNKTAESSAKGSSEPGPNLFAATAPQFGQPKEQPSKSSETTTTPASTSLFGVQAQKDDASHGATPSVLQSQTLFGTATIPKDTKGMQPQESKPLASFSTQPTAPATSATSSQPSTGSVFGSVNKGNGLFGSTASGNQSTAKPLFGASSSTPSSTIFNFGGSKPATAAEGDKSLSESKPLFGSVTTTKPAEEAQPLFGAASAGQGDGSKAQPSIFGSTSTTPASTFNFGASQSSAPAVSFGSSAPQQSSAPSTGPLFFGGGNNASGGSSFTFTAGGNNDQPFRNPFASGDFSSGGATSFDFGAASSGASAATSGASFQFGGGQTGPTSTPAPASGGSAAPMFSFGGGQQPAGAPAPSSNMFGGATNPGSSGPVFNFGGSSQPAASSLFPQQKFGQPLFNLAPPMGGTSTGTNTPFTFGGASSLATTPATGTPEPGATQDQTDPDGPQADGNERPQEQISLTEGGPGEEDETVVHEVRAKALRLVTSKDGSDSEENARDKKSPWKTMGVGPLRVLKHKTTGAVRLLLRAEPRGHVALNKSLLPNFVYKPEPGGPYVKLTVANDSGVGLETWMLQVKKKEAAQALADILEANKGADKK